MNFLKNMYVLHRCIYHGCICKKPLLKARKHVSQYYVVKLSYCIYYHKRDVLPQETEESTINIKFYMKIFIVACIQSECSCLIL